MGHSSILTKHYSHDRRRIRWLLLGKL